MYSMEVCVSTVSIIVGDDALGVPYRFVAVGFVFQPFIFNFQVTFGV